MTENLHPKLLEARKRFITRLEARRNRAGAKEAARGATAEPGAPTNAPKPAKTTRAARPGETLPKAGGKGAKKSRT